VLDQTWVAHERAERLASQALGRRLALEMKYTSEVAKVQGELLEQQVKIRAAERRVIGWKEELTVN